MDDFATGYLAGQDGGNNNGGFFGNEGLSLDAGTDAGRCEAAQYHL